MTLDEGLGDLGFRGNDCALGPRAPSAFLVLSRRRLHRRTHKRSFLGVLSYALHIDRVMV